MRTRLYVVLLSVVSIEISFQTQDGSNFTQSLMGRFLLVCVVMAKSINCTLFSAPTMSLKHSTFLLFNILFDQIINRHKATLTQISIYCIQICELFIYLSMYCVYYLFICFHICPCLLVVITSLAWVGCQIFYRHSVCWIELMCLLTTQLRD